MKIKTKEFIDRIVNLYNVVSSQTKISIDNIEQNSFWHILPYLPDEESKIATEFNEFFCTLDLECADAEFENRDIDKNLIKNIADKILEKINYYKYFIEIDLSQYSPILDMNIKEYINIYTNVKPDFSIELNSIVQDGIKSFGLNDVTIIDFIRQVSIELKKSNILLFKDSQCYKDIEQSLRDWEKDKTDKLIFKYGKK